MRTNTTRTTLLSVGTTGSLLAALAGAALLLAGVVTFSGFPDAPVQETTPEVLRMVPGADAGASTTRPRAVAVVLLPAPTPAGETSPAALGPSRPAGPVARDPVDSGAGAGAAGRPVAASGSTSSGSPPGAAGAAPSTPAGVVADTLRDATSAVGGPASAAGDEMAQAVERAAAVLEAVPLGG